MEKLLLGFTIGVVASLLLIYLVELLVDAAEILVESLVVVELVLILDVLPHVSVPALCDNLGLLQITSSRNLRTLLDAISLHHVVVRLFLQLFALVGHFLGLRNYSHHF